VRATAHWTSGARSVKDDAASKFCWKKNLCNALALVPRTRQNVDPCRFFGTGPFFADMFMRRPDARLSAWRQRRFGYRSPIGGHRAGDSAGPCPIGDYLPPRDSLLSGRDAVYRRVWDGQRPGTGRIVLAIKLSGRETA